MFQRWRLSKLKEKRNVVLISCEQLSKEQSNRTAINAARRATALLVRHSYYRNVKKLSAEKKKGISPSVFSLDTLQSRSQRYVNQIVA